MNSLSQGNLATAKKAQHQTRQLTTSQKDTSTRTPQKHANPVRTSQMHNTPTTWTNNRRIWDKGQKAIIKEESSHNGHTSMAYQHEISSEYHCPESQTTYTFVVPRGHHGTTLHLPPSSTPHHHLSTIFYSTISTTNLQTPPPDGTLQITQ